MKEVWGMEIEKVLSIIEKGSMSIYLGSKRQSKGKRYFIYRVSVSDKIEKWIKDKHLEFIKINEKETTEYNPIISQKDIIEIIPNNSINGLTDMLHNIENTDTTNNIKKFKAKFMILQYEYNGTELIIVRRMFGENRLDQSLLAKLQDGYYDQIESDNSFFIDNEIDMIISKDATYIYHHISVERVFFMIEEFRNNAEKVLTVVEEKSKGKIKNFNSIKEKIIDHGRNVRRVAKLFEDNNRSTLFLDNFNTTIETIRDLKLNINITEEDGETFIDITDDTEINELINLMQDSYYKTIIGGRDGIDELN